MTQTFNGLREVFPMIGLFRKEDEKSKTAAEVKKAREICREAQTEAKHARTAEDLIRTSADDNLRQNFRAIADWHHARAARKFREAAALFGELRNYRLSAKTREHFKRKAQKMITSAAENEKAGSNL